MMIDKNPDKKECHKKVLDQNIIYHALKRFLQKFFVLYLRKIIFLFDSCMKHSFKISPSVSAWCDSFMILSIHSRESKCQMVLIMGRGITITVQQDFYIWALFEVQNKQMDYFLRLVSEVLFFGERFVAHHFNNGSVAQW